MRTAWNLLSCDVKSAFLKGDKFVARELYISHTNPKTSLPLPPGCAETRQKPREFAAITILAGASGGGTSRYWGVPNTLGTLGVPITRTILFLGSISGSSDLEKLPYVHPYP